MKSFFKYFVQGLLVLAPIGLTLYVLFGIVSFFIDYLTQFKVLGGNIYIDAFAVLLIAVVVIWLVGVLGNIFLFQYFYRVFERTVEKAPLIKVIYSSIKDFLGAFVGNKKRFTKPVLVTINKENGIQQIGFITDEDLSELQIPKGKVAVYMPHSYAISGVLLVVPVENLTPLNIPAADAMKYIVSGGVADIDQDEDQVKV